MENGHERRVYGSMLDLACDVRNPSPLVELPLGLKHATVSGKLEWYNPFGSVKDRVALQLVDDALGSGKVKEGDRLVEASSGNTALGLAMAANAKGLKLSVPISSRVPPEKRNALRFFGAEVIELEDSL
jgi:cysteine synthase